MLKFKIGRVWLQIFADQVNFKKATLKNCKEIWQRGKEVCEILHPRAKEQLSVLFRELHPYNCHENPYFCYAREKTAVFKNAKV